MSNNSWKNHKGYICSQGKLSGRTREKITSHVETREGVIHTRSLTHATDPEKSEDKGQTENNS